METFDQDPKNDPPLWMDGAILFAISGLIALIVTYTKSKFALWW